MSIVLVGSSSGSITLQEPAVAGTTTLNLPATSGTVVVTGTTPTLNGITFPATAVPSADANTLDDYEEGTWTPTIRGYSTEFSSVTYTSQNGRYIKIGKLVTCQGQVQWSSKSGGSGVFCMAGLPFSTSDGSGQSVANIQEYNGFTFTGRTQLGAEIFSSIVYVNASGSATTPVGVDVSNVASSGYFYFSFSYIATA
jgi:hypothetical protein